MKPDIEKLREKYINNPPEGMTSADIRHMSEEELLDMDYFLNEDIFDDELLKKLVNRFQNREEEINIYNLMLEGYCSSCKKEKEKEGK